MTKKRQRMICGASMNLVTAVIVLICLLPMLWLMVSSFKPSALVSAIPPVMVFKPTLENFVHVIHTASFMKGYLNSLIVASGTSVVSIYLGITAGFALARIQTGWGHAMGAWIIIIRMVPPILFVLPLYNMYRTAGLLDTYTGLIIANLTITVPFVTWLMMGFFKGVPMEIEESSRIDGCGIVRTMVSVSIPIVKPGIVTCIIFTFIMSWNEYLYALILTGRRTITAPILVQSFVAYDGVQWGNITAAGLLVTLPILIISVFAQKGLVQGLTVGSIK